MTTEPNFQLPSVRPVMSRKGIQIIAYIARLDLYIAMCKAQRTNAWGQLIPTFTTNQINQARIELEDSLMELFDGE